MEGDRTHFTVTWPFRGRFSSIQWVLVLLWQLLLQSPLLQGVKLSGSIGPRPQSCALPAPLWVPGSTCSFIRVMTWCRSTEPQPPRTLFKGAQEGRCWCAGFALGSPRPHAMTQLLSFTVRELLATGRGPRRGEDKLQPSAQTSPPLLPTRLLLPGSWVPGVIP